MKYLGTSQANSQTPKPSGPVFIHLVNLFRAGERGRGGAKAFLRPFGTVSRDLLYKYNYRLFNANYAILKPRFMTDTQNVFLISLTLPPFVSVNPDGKENKARTSQKVIKRTASSLTDLCFSPLTRDWELLLQLHTLLKFFQMYRLGLGFTWKVMSWSHILDSTRLGIWLEICYKYTYAEVTCMPLEYY